MVEEDWERQEVRKGRNAEMLEAFREAVARVAATIQRRGDAAGSRFAPALAQSLEQLQRDKAGWASLDKESRLALYRRARWMGREIVLEDAGVSRQPLLFMKRNRFVCQMLHEYMGYFYDYGKVAPGGGIFVLEQPGQSLRTRDLIRGRLRNGNFTTLAVAPDAYDLSQWAPPVGNQGQVGSCTSWATGYYERYWLRNHALGETTLFAPMFLYAQISQGVDRGSTFYDGISYLFERREALGL